MLKSFPTEEADKILNEFKEGYKKDPNKYKEKLVFYIYAAWIKVLPTNEKYQKYPLSFFAILM